MKNKLIYVKCIICGNRYPKRHHKKLGGDKKADIRGINTVTCSAQCSKKLTRVRQTKGWMEAKKLT